MLVGHEWVGVDEGVREVTEALDALEQRGNAGTLRQRWLHLTIAGEKRGMLVAPDVVHALRDSRAASN